MFPFFQYEIWNNKTRMYCQGTEGTTSPDCLCPAPLKLRLPCPQPRTLFQTKDHQSLPQWCRSKASLQLLTDLPCLAMALPSLRLSPSPGKCPKAGDGAAPAAPRLPGSLSGVLEWDRLPGPSPPPPQGVPSVPRYPQQSQAHTLPWHTNLCQNVSCLITSKLKTLWEVFAIFYCFLLRSAVVGTSAHSSSAWKIGASSILFTKEMLHVLTKLAVTQTKLHISPAGCGAVFSFLRS